MKKFSRPMFIGCLFLVGLLAVFAKYQFSISWNGKDDSRMWIKVKNGETLLINISPSRRMVSILTVAGESAVWDPGVGWEKADRMTSEIKKWGLFNFGFIDFNIDEVNNADEWRDFPIMFKRLGPLGWLRFKLMEDQLIVKREKMPLDLDGREVLLEEIMSRDMADTRILQGENRFILVNTSRIDGLAGFLAERLGWSGYLVVGTESSDEEIEGCELRIKKGTKIDFGIEKLKEVLMCGVVEQETIVDNEVEVILGKKWGEMLKYESFKSNNF